MELFSESQYDINEIKSVKLPVTVAAELGGFSLSQESVDAVVSNCRNITGYDFQYVLSARPAGSVATARKNNLPLVSPGLRVLCLVEAAEVALVEIHLSKSLEHWARVFGGEVSIRTFNSLKDKDLICADVVVFQRIPTKKALIFAKQIKSNGTAVIFEIDDLLKDVHKILDHHNVYLKAVRKNYSEMAGIADAISVSTPILAQHMRKLTPHVFVVPNYAEPMPQTSRHFATALSDCKLLVSSGDDILIDFLIEPIRQIQQETGVQVIAIGPPGKRLFEAGIKVDQQPIMNHDDYKSYISSLDNCIGLAPLESSVFSSCKTAIKFFEYSASGLPVIASNVPPFSNVIENGVDGFLVENSTAQWLDAMRNLITSHQLREQINKAAQNTVQAGHNADIAARAWQELFRSLGITHAQLLKNSMVSFKLPRVLGVRRRDLAWLNALGRQMLRPTAYKKALATILSDGPQGLFLQLKRL